MGTAYLGWAATAVFVASYFCPRPALLRGVQMIGAAMWILYGFLIGAAPVVVANLLVLAAAAWTARGTGEADINLAEVLRRRERASDPNLE